MIIACSSNALQLIEKSIFNRRSKGDAFPLIVSDKDQLAFVRSFFDNDPECHGLLWNLDIEESPLSERGGKQIGVHRYGYLFNRDFGTSVVLNALDCTDMCNIGRAAEAGIRTILQDFVIAPEVIEEYFVAIYETRRHLLEAPEMKGQSPMYWRVPAILFANNNRSVTTIIRNLKDSVYFKNSRGGINYVSSEPVDRSLCFDLNREMVKAKKAASGELGYVMPLENTRKSILGSGRNLPTPAVKIRVQLVDYKDKAFEPLCFRELVLPLSAPLEWVHHMIQKTFNWVDYHLHHFDFLDREAARMLSDAFFSISGIEQFHMGEEPENLFDQEDGEQRFMELTNLSLRWLYGDFIRAMERQGMMEDEYPAGHLPESMPLGLALLGSSSYPDMLQRLAETKDAIPAKEQEFKPIRYEYDYGDGWELSVVPIDFMMANSLELPQITNAAGHTPPEDCGGIGGFANFLADIDPDDDYQHEDVDLLDWALGNGWQPFTSVEDLKDHFSKPSTWGH